MSRGLFVTGTDTGVGKTLVSCALLRALARRGHRIGVYKPAETGVPRDAQGVLRGEDCVRLLAAADTGQAPGSESRALYPVPAAPLVAAEAAGDAIDPDDLVRGFDALLPHFDAVWVEGAGGLLVPIAEGFHYADLVARLQLPVLLVVGSKLGCINHALLTLSELDRRDIPVAGYVLNSVDTTSEAPHAVASNRETLARCTRHRDLGQLSHLPPDRCDDFDAAAALAERELDLTAIEGALGVSPRRR